MTREEREQAIAILENEKKCVNRANKNDYCNRDCYNCELVKTDIEILTALDMAIQALEQSMPTMVYPQVDGITPTVVAQADGEYIPKQAVLENIDQWYEDKADIEDLIVKITYMPSVAIPNKVGHWIKNADEGQNIDPPYICSECGNAEIRQRKFCAECGCPMEIER